MADQQVDKFISELSQILERNRQQRANTENELAKSDAQQVASGGGTAGNGLNASSGFAQGLKGGMGQKKPTDDKAGQEAINAKDYRDKSSSYGGDVAVNPYNLRVGMATPEGMSPSTTSAGRVGLAQNYARTQELLADNPYRLEENAAPPGPADSALEEQKKRFTQRLMNQRGEAGGPLGGAGQQGADYGNPKDPYLNQDTTVPASVLSPSVTARGRVGAGQDAAHTQQLLASNPYAQPAPEAIPYPTPQQPDMALYEAYQAMQRQRGGL